MAMDPADVIPDAEDSDDEEEAINPSSTWVAVIGGGPVGLIAAMYMARRGFQVDVYEKEDHPATRPATAFDYPALLSSRALLALTELGVSTSFTDQSAPVYRGCWHIGPPDSSGSGSAAASSSGGSGTAAEATAQPAPRASARLESAGGQTGQYLRSALVGRQQLERELAREASRLYPHRLRLNYKAELRELDLQARVATIFLKQSLDGNLMLAGSAPTSPGRCLHAMCYRPAAVQASSPASPTQTTDTLLPELAAAALEAACTHRVGYSLLLGADGAESGVRAALLSARPKVRDLEVQRPAQDLRQQKHFSGLRQVPVEGELTPSMAVHAPGEYVYRMEAGSGPPQITLWVSAPGCVSGVISLGPDQPWEAGALQQALLRAYGPALPHEWLTAILQQVCGAASPAPQQLPANVSCTQFHGPRTVLLGDAAHAMTDELGQALSCAIEGVRMLNLVLKVSGNALDKSPQMYSQMRGEDTHCMQQLEGLQRSLRPGIKYADAFFGIAGFLSVFVWRSALLMLAVLQAALPARFPHNYIQACLADARKGYSDTLKVVVRLAAAPVLFALLLTAVVLRGALANFKWSALIFGLGG